MGIEVIGEHEDGYIIGASVDVILSELAAKIDKFALKGQDKVAVLWEIVQGKAWRIERILLPLLSEEWLHIRDSE
jgi:hypothetical protein